MRTLTNYSLTFRQKERERERERKEGNGLKMERDNFFENHFTSFKTCFVNYNFQHFASNLSQMGKILYA